MKIISLVPSITELLFDLGLENKIIGRTKFCIHPMPQVKEVQQYGGTKNIHLEKIIAAQPDLIIVNKEENLKHDVEELQKFFNVEVTDISDLQSNNQMILRIGILTNTKKKAEKLVNIIQSEFEKLPDFDICPKALYLIWKNPLMSIGSDTFIHNMLTYAGFENVCADQLRYPVIEHPSVYQPDFIFLSSEPFPFIEKHVTEIHKVFPNAKIILTDGEMFSWYGSRMQYAPAYFLALRKHLQI